jgi:hypothetical protein
VTRLKGGKMSTGMQTNFCVKAQAGACCTFKKKRSPHQKIFKAMDLNDGFLNMKAPPNLVILTALLLLS